jgi:hypothetical protein
MIQIYLVTLNMCNTYTHMKSLLITWRRYFFLIYICTDHSFVIKLFINAFSLFIPTYNSFTCGVVKVQCQMLKFYIKSKITLMEIEI